MPRPRLSWACVPEASPHWPRKRGHGTPRLLTDILDALQFGLTSLTTFPPLPSVGSRHVTKNRFADVVGHDLWIRLPGVRTGPRGARDHRPAQAAKDPDFLIQGEYLGHGTWLDGEHAKAGGQVIALGNGKFDLVITKGGLPGDGWKRGDAQFSMKGRREGDVTALDGPNASGKITGEAMTIAGSDGKAKLELKRTVRHSSTEGAKPPEGAVVLFDGTTADKFRTGT